MTKSKKNKSHTSAFLKNPNTGEKRLINIEEAISLQKESEEPLLFICNGKGKNFESCNAEMEIVRGYTKSDGTSVRSHFREKMPDTHVEGCIFDRSKNVITKEEISKALEAFNPDALYERLCHPKEESKSKKPSPKPGEKGEGNESDDDSDDMNTTYEHKFIAPRTMNKAYQMHMDGVYGIDDYLEGTFASGKSVKETFLSSLTCDYYHKYPNKLSGKMIIHVRKTAGGILQAAFDGGYRGGWILCDPYSVDEDIERLHFYLNFEKENVKQNVIKMLMDAKGNDFLVFADWERKPTLEGKYRMFECIIKGERQVAVLNIPEGRDSRNY